MSAARIRRLLPVRGGDGRNRRRTALLCGVLCTGLLGTAAAVSLGGSGGHGSAAPAQERAVLAPQKKAPQKASVTPEWDGKVRVIGDGSTSDTGPQPNQPTPHKLKPGEKPPQFVVFSWDGALENDDHLFSRFRKLAAQNDAHMTFFLSGIYLLPDGKRSLYKPPQHSPGTSAIDFPTDEHIRWTLSELRQAWEDGDEIGTHFNGHFCAPDPGGGGNWSTADWDSEIAQAYSFVEHWKTDTGFTDIPPLPFDYSEELAGGRAPAWRARRTCSPPRRRTAGATTPAHPATSRSGR